MKQLSWRWHLGLILGLVFLVYIPALRSGFIWDDDAYVTANAALRSLRGLWEIWTQPGRLDQYYPLTYSSFWLDYHLWGLRPVGYHFVNVLLHALNAFLAGKLLQRLKVRGAGFISFLFLLHPVMVESVAWITERKNVLSGFFCLLSLEAYLRSRDHDTRSWPWYLISLVLFTAALTAKTVTGTLPLVILLILWWKEGQWLKKDILRMLPFLGIAIVLSSITLTLETRHLTITGIGEWTFSFPERCLIAGRALWFYLGKLLWPYPLAFIYPRWTVPVNVFLPWAFPVFFVLALGILGSSQKKWGRAPFTSLAIFAVMMLPALGFRSFYPMRYSFVADHFQYLAAIAPLALMTAGVLRIVKGRNIRILLGAAILTACALLSFRQCHIYKDLETLWRDTLIKNPGAWLAHNNLGALLQQKGALEEAEFHFKETLRLNPGFAAAYNNLGFLKEKEGQTEEALAYYQKAIQLQPRSGEFRFYLGSFLHGLGRLDESILYYEKAAELIDNFAAPCYNLGRIFTIKGETERAVHWYNEAIHRNPHFMDTYFALADLLAKSGDPEKAIAQYQEVLKLDPANAAAKKALQSIRSKTS